MKRILLGAALAALLSGTAMAQTANSNAGATSGAAAGANSGSASGAAIILDQSSKPTNSGNIYYPAIPRDTKQTIVAAPPIALGGISTGNVCAIGGGGGGSFLGTGILVQATWESMMCENRHRAALMANMGDKSAAKELMCGSDKVIYDAYKTGGTPCAVRPEWEPKPAPGAPVVSQPIAPAPVQTVALFRPRPGMTAADCLNEAPASQRAACAGLK